MGYIFLLCFALLRFYCSFAHFASNQSFTFRYDWNIFFQVKKDIFFLFEHLWSLNTGQPLDPRSTLFRIPLITSFLVLLATSSRFLCCYQTCTWRYVFLPYIRFLRTLTLVKKLGPLTTFTAKKKIPDCTELFVTTIEIGLTYGLKLWNM